MVSGLNDPPAPLKSEAGFASLTGWLLDVYAAPEGEPGGGVVAWLLGDDGVRRRLVLPFPVAFYASGPAPRLRDLWRFLRKSSQRVTLKRDERRELFSPQPLSVLSVQTESPALLNDLFRLVSGAFPDLTYFDADIAVHLHCAARWGVFPLARCLAVPGEVWRLEALDTPWELEPPIPPLRILSIEPDVDPDHAPPRLLKLQAGENSYRLPLEPARPLLINLAAILNRHDPDLLLTSWGDGWMLPMLIERSRELGLPLPLNRDPACEIAHRQERSYFSYGQVIYRDRQVHLFGRWHLDRRNAMLWDDYTLAGVLESARVTGLPVQTAARTSPGTGISSMQIVTALRLQVLVPWRKSEPERFKRAADLFAADQGGMVYQPLVGLHANVGGIDFVSMYPGIMVRFNISPETAGTVPHRADELAPIPQPFPPPLPHPNPLPLGEGRGEGGVAIEGEGLVPQTLAPLLRKRVELKGCLASMPNWDPRRELFKARSSAHKWLLVTCFGYLGYRNARFGRIEAHEAVTAYGREALLRAKETAEDLDFTVLHMYVDGLWVQREGAEAVQDFQPLLDAIVERTGLPIALDGVYRWVVFLPSRLDERLPVPNRYYGVFQDGSLKVRGIEARRRDTPPFIAETQMEMLEFLAQAPSAVDLPDYLPDAHRYLKRRLEELRQGCVPLEKLLAALRLSRELEQYRTASPAARAAAQLQRAGKEIRPGQRIRLLYLRGRPGVHAWDLPEPPDRRCLDLDYYARLMLRAAEAVFLPLGGKDLLYPVQQKSLFPERHRRMPHAKRLE